MLFHVHRSVSGTRQPELTSTTPADPKSIAGGSKPPKLPPGVQSIPDEDPKWLAWMIYVETVYGTPGSPRPTGGDPLYDDRQSLEPRGSDTSGEPDGLDRWYDDGGS